MLNNKANPKGKAKHNVNRATVVGGTAGAGGSVVITWLAMEGERRYGIPFAVSAAVLGGAVAFLTRWAAKLLPDA